VSAEVLREYLVSLGYKIDPASFERFKSALATGTKETAKLGAEIAGVGMALTAMVEHVARTYENLGYLSQRTGATVSSLDAVSFAAQQVGVSAQEAQSAVESFASAMRRNPGTRAFFQGVTGRASTGHPETDIRNFVRSQQGVPDFVALQRASMLGIDEHTYLQYKNNLDTLEQAEADHIRRMKEAGLSADEEGLKFVEFGRIMNHLADQFGIAGTRIAKDWRPSVETMIKQLDDVAGGFARADNASSGLLGRVTGLVAALGGVSAALSVLSRWFPFLGLASAGTNAVAGGAGLSYEAAQMVANNPQIFTPIANNPMLSGMSGDYGMAAAIMDAARGRGVTGWPTSPSKTSMSGGGGRSTMPLPQGPKVPSTSRVWGDTEGVFGGLYDAPAVKYAPRATTHST
jgi:hypothetical protein